MRRNDKRLAEIRRLSLHRQEPRVLPAVLLKMGRSKNVLAVVLIGLAVGSSAWAEKTDSKACTEQERSNQTLSERLDQTNGVICPPDIDPGMKAPTPGHGEDAGDPAARQPGW